MSSPRHRFRVVPLLPADAGDPKNKCGWCPDMYGVRNNEAGQAWYDSMYRLYASWGLDFVKVDDLSNPYHKEEIEMIRKAIDKCGRPIVFSTSPGPTPIEQAQHIAYQANQWRISGDFWDRWKDLDHQFDRLAKWSGIAGPGHFPDGDMIPFGHIGIKCTIAISGSTRTSVVLTRRFPPPFRHTARCYCRRNPDPYSLDKILPCRLLDCMHLTTPRLWSNSLSHFFV